MNIVALTQQDFLGLLDRLLSYDYLASLKTGSGYEVYQQMAAIGSRASLAIANFQTASFISTAPDGGYAQAVVGFSRANSYNGAVTIKAGTIVQTATYGRRFSLLYDVVFSSTDLMQQGIVQALYQGEQWNVLGPRTTLRGETIPGEISIVSTWIQDPSFGDPTITVSQFSDATGGLSSVLNIHGSDRGFIRNTNEPANIFRHRVRSLPDTVSPLAIRNLLDLYTANYPGTVWDFIEVWQPTFQSAWDCPSPNIGTPTYSSSILGQISTNLFVFDDPRPAWPPFQNRWLDESISRGMFIVTVPHLAAVADHGLAYDDIAETPAALQSAYGRRSVNAYDVPRTTIITELQGAYDGLDYQIPNVYLGLISTLQRTKAAGVVVDIEIQGE